MPRLDGTGPNGAGSGTGRGMGPCGAGMAWGRGFGRGWARMANCFCGYCPCPVNKEEEIKILEQEMKAIKTRMAELKKEK